MTRKRVGPNVVKSEGGYAVDEEAEKCGREYSQKWWGTKRPNSGKVAEGVSGPKTMA